MGRLFDLIQAHMDAQPYGVSERAIAIKLGVSPTTLRNWKSPTRLIDKEHLVAISRLTGDPYGRVLDALLEDIGYLRPEAPPPPEKRRRAAG
jgi:DNA-binding transcriptional regulator YdaS (Cro superfamily)